MKQFKCLIPEVVTKTIITIQIYNSSEKEVIKYGIHSNIPKCCVNYYIKRNNRIKNNFKHPFEQYHSKTQKQAEQILKKDFNYVACFKCLFLLNWNQLHICENCPEDQEYQKQIYKVA